jgi:2-methylcitrate dehydratase PrpD
MAPSNEGVDMAAAVEDATTRLARHVLDLDVAVLPEEVAVAARTVLADTLGVLCAASARTAVRTALEAMPLGTGPCTVVGHGVRAAPDTAALVNGIGGHDIELDDLHAASRTHPASVIVPAALAAAEHLGGCRYGDVLSGIVAGYDVMVRVSRALGTIAQYERGFHPSSVTGAVGAAVCAGRIFGLSIDEMRWAVGLAASQSSGLLTYYDDPYHMAKSFQTGIAARNGMTAALLAGAGYRAAPDVLTGRHSMLTPFGGAAADPAELVADLGRRFEILFTTIKRHASCALTHAAVDALLDLLDEHGVTVDTIQRIEVRVPHAAAPSIDGNVLWTHNIQYVLALAAHQRTIAVEHFSLQWTRNAEIANLAARVTVAGDDDLQQRFPAQNGAIVTLITPNAEFVRHRAGPRGSPAEPLTSDELSEKFTQLAGSLLGPAGAAALWHAVATTGVDDGVDAILDLLSAPAGSFAGPGPANAPGPASPNKTSAEAGHEHHAIR